MVTRWGPAGEREEGGQYNLLLKCLATARKVGLQPCRMIAGLHWSNGRHVDDQTVLGEGGSDTVFEKDPLDDIAIL